MLFIYSGESPELDAVLLQTLGPHHTLTLIPASPQDIGIAKAYAEHFRCVGLRARTRSLRFYRDPLRLQQIMMNSDAVYLMGGNTFEFLAYAYTVDLFESLRDYESSGGIIVSESAGSIILSPTIATALIPTSNPDEQVYEFDGYRGMGRIPFHVSPHFDPTAASAAQDLAELQALADYSRCAVMVLRDGEGFVIEDERVIQQIGQPLELTPALEPQWQVALRERLPAWAMAT